MNLSNAVWDYAHKVGIHFKTFQDTPHEITISFYTKEECRAVLSFIYKYHRKAFYKLSGCITGKNDFDSKLMTEWKDPIFPHIVGYYLYWGTEAEHYADKD